MPFQNSRERSTTPNFTKSRGRLTSESSRTSPTIQENEENGSDSNSGFYSLFGSNCEDVPKNPDFPFRTQFQYQNDEIKVKDFVSAAMDILVIYGNFLALKASI